MGFMGLTGWIGFIGRMGCTGLNGRIGLIGRKGLFGSFMRRQGIMKSSIDTFALSQGYHLEYHLVAS
jgi:hypothetical protein